MSLYLVQHGKCLSKEKDPNRSLSEEGIMDVERIAAMAREHNIQVTSIIHSGKKRALQTAEIFASALQPSGNIEERVGLNPLDDVSVFAEGINSKENLMVVGHLPFLEKLTSYLISGSPDSPVIKFQNGGIVCLGMNADQDAWVIKWTMMPNME